MVWTIREVHYLEEHGHDGTEAVAAALGRSEGSVKAQARRYGVSLRPRWQCPNCGHVTYRPLSCVTGWCQVCTMAARREQIAAEVADMEEELRREQAAKRERQRLYSRKSRAKAKMLRG